MEDHKPRGEMFFDDGQDGFAYNAINHSFEFDFKAMTSGCKHVNKRLLNR